MDNQSLLLVKEVAKEALNQSLQTRFDICRCALCKEAMLKRIMEDLANLAYPLSEKTIQEVRKLYMGDINRAIVHAIGQVSFKPPHSVTENLHLSFKKLLEKIRQDRGLDLRHYHAELLKRRIALRLHKNNLSSYKEYIKLLDRKPEEYNKLFETLCINVSEFFRDPPVWVTIQYLFENLLRLKQNSKDKNLKIWSCGCACGEEPYSLAIVLKEALRSYPTNIKGHILATDIDKACLECAQKAAYPKEQLKNVENKILARYFEPKGNQYVVKEDTRQLVEFQYLDLTCQSYPEQIDVIVCRNVFIYFDRVLQNEIINKFYNSVKTGGYLILGKTEFPEMNKRFEIVDPNARIFRKVNLS
ncbi:MAG: protein-glutamate O-methyltransferase CheR [Candidatus Omnitrophica bacterium]|nr:protein-glutamate O-methyltransferase CheR [Candidatus Omnitrophota bacterium]